MRAYMTPPLPENTIHSADDADCRTLPTAFLLLEAELMSHALSETHAPRLADIEEEHERADAA